MRQYFPLCIFLALVVLIQLVTQITETAFYLTQLTMSAYYSLLIIGLCTIMGYAGQISLGHAGFFAIGGYLSAGLTTHNLQPFADTGITSLLDKAGLLVSSKDLYGDTLLTVHPWIACIVAISTAVIIALVLGGPVLKLKGHYLAMATLGFGIIIFRIAMATPYFGEADGLSGVPSFTLLPGITVSGDFGARIINYYIAWGTVLIGMLLLINLVNSRMGRALSALHGSEEAAQAMGVNTARAKLLTFVLSAAYAALAGVLLTHYNGSIGPGEAGVMKSVRYVAIVAIGGMAHLWGALIIGTLLNFMSMRGLFGSYDDAVFGIILILIMLFAPQGLLRLHIWKHIQKIKPKKHGTA
ncbi:MAG: branched-chain amino acid ABC transporter permease [Desulfobulbaceae bacterium]|uniref:Branched-chain amino acid ABC transporter permease n=1 Tax=Candidatus Desulfobia pelagia TaxID=2841692 RepID=A0A8J6NEE5_9BACT|nr:branched-chain amino acid ABC transporter permease [Candidatus Desulfobia pelagia]